jgi:hypothetical protein
LDRTSIRGYAVWSVAFGLSAYISLAFPYAWVLATTYDRKNPELVKAWERCWDAEQRTDAVQCTDTYEFGTMGITIVGIALGFVVFHLRTHPPRWFVAQEGGTVAASPEPDRAQLQGTPLPRRRGDGGCLEGENA